MDGFGSTTDRDASDVSLPTGAPPAGDLDLRFLPFVVNSSWYNEYWYQREPVRRGLINQASAFCAKIPWRRRAFKIDGRERYPNVVANSIPAE